MHSLEIDFFYGLFGAVLFRIRNEQPDYQNWILGFVIGLFLSQALYVYWSEIGGQYLWVISAIGLGVTYYLRFTRKVSTKIIDFLKLFCIFLLIIFPLTFATIVPNWGVEWDVLRSLTLPFVAIIYIYDRWILKEAKMKRKFVFILVAQTLVILVLFAYALLQKASADKHRQLAVEQARRAEEERFNAEKIRQQFDSLRESEVR